MEKGNLVALGTALFLAVLATASYFFETKTEAVVVMMTITWGLFVVLSIPVVITLVKKKTKARP